MKTAHQTILLLGMMLILASALTAVTVAGTVVGSDAPTIGLSDATVSLSGNNNYTASTNAMGNFTISEVEGNVTYSYLIEKEGYSPADGNINVGDVNYSMGTIMLNELAYPPQNVMAAQVTPNVYIHWFPPIEMYPYLGYKVWRLAEGQEENEAVWSLLTVSAITETALYDQGWSSLPSGTYLWAVRAVYQQNVLSPAAFSNPLVKTVANPDSDNQLVITGLNKCQPNPFNFETDISFALKNASPVRLEIFNTKGQVVKILINEMRAGGNYSVRWNGMDNTNQKLSNGIYLCKMTAGKSVSVRKLNLLK